jgi:hypothetical protein
MDTDIKNLKRAPIIAILRTSLLNFIVCAFLFYLFINVFRDLIADFGSGYAFYVFLFYFMLILSLGIYIGILLLFYVVDKKKFLELDRAALIERQMPLVALFSLFPLFIAFISIQDNQGDLLAMSLSYFFATIFGYIFFIFDVKK